jgi:hypothetical protein
MKFRKILTRYSRSDVTVLEPANDPFRQNTPAGRRDAKWFREQIEPLVALDLRPHRKIGRLEDATLRSRCGINTFAGLRYSGLGHGSPLLNSVF